MTHRGLVILDRDGVINEDRPDHVRDLASWRPISGSIAAIARLNSAGYRVAVATNQSGLARGFLDRSMLGAIHAHMEHCVRAGGGRLDAIAFCPHASEDRCTCRKPEPGLLHEISQELGMDLQGVPFVGDSLRDLQAARRAGCIPVLVRTGNGRRTVEHPAAADVAVHEDLGAFVDAFVECATEATRRQISGQYQDQHQRCGS